MRPAVVRGSSGRTRGRTSNHLPTITTPKPTAKPEPEATSNTGVHIRELTPAPFLTHGACAGHPNPDLWYPTIWTKHGVEYHDVTKAKLICHTCPIEIQCGEWAIENQERDGIYGGLTPHERGLLSRSAQRWQQRKESA